MKIARAIVFVFAIFLLVVAIVSMVEELRRQAEFDMARLIGYSIGSFFPAFVFFGIAYLIHKRIKRKLAKSAYENFLVSDIEKERRSS